MTTGAEVKADETARAETAAGSGPGPTPTPSPGPSPGPRPVEPPPGRPWEERGYLWLRRWRDLVMAPLVVPLARLGVPPWSVSLAGVAFAAALYPALPRSPLLALAAFAGALLCDAVDGALARRRGCDGTWGKILDLLCDSATLAAVLLALVSVAAVPPVRAVYAAYVTLLLLFVAVCYNATRGSVRTEPPVGSSGFDAPPTRLRGGFYAHLPKAPVYAALVVWLVGGPQWVAAAVLVSNVLATVFVLLYLLTLLRPTVTLPVGSRGPTRNFFQ